VEHVEEHIEIIRGVSTLHVASAPHAPSNAVPIDPLSG